ncbi:MAG: hypothetical protein GXN95_01005 [Methanococci archaeon]|nr:hypothetical protein [Methanococci archaeon]
MVITMEKPWVEKYRPKTLDDIVGQDEIVKRLKKYVEKKSMPHLLFSGPPGVGKCLTGDTKVIVNGKIREIEEVVEEISNGNFGATLTNNLKVLGIDEDGKIREFDVQYVYKDKTNTLIKIKTKMGRELKVTTYHPLLINHKNGEIKWEKAENLKVGDKLAVPCNIIYKKDSFVFKDEKLKGKGLIINENILNYLSEKLNLDVDLGRDVLKEILYKLESIDGNIDDKLRGAILYLIFLHENQLYWDEIVEIEQLNGEFTIYDLHVPKYHNFIGGNLPTILHNTTAALCLARDLFGENWRDNFLELNASVSKDTPILVKIDGKIKRTTFEELDKIYFETDDENEMYKKVDNLEVLTADENFKVRWRKVSTIIRHKVDKILRIKFEGGYIELTGNHSIMMLDEEGLVAKKAGDIKVGDCFLSFVANIEGEKDKLDLKEFEPKDITSRVKVINDFEVDEDTAWMLGLYTAEGAVGFKGETSGQIIYTLGSHEHELINKLNDIVDKKGFSKYENFTGSGFDRNRLSAKQIRILNTQLARFVEKNFYDGNGRRARNKRIPNIIFELKENLRVEFLKGLADGDGSGNWGEVVRISSKSDDLLIDTVWLARISGIESSIFENEARLIWKGGMKWKKSNLLPAEPIIKMIKKLENKINGNWRYILRHQLYEGKKRVSKDKIKQILEMVDINKLSDEERKVYDLLKKLSETELHALVVKEIEVINYNDFVYDVSVPNNEMFFAGNVPILLHNSDERGIDVIRTKVKDFARTKPIGDVPFKIIFLDESDALTADAQNALRRTMEKYSDVCRFILSCLTGDAKITLPDEREIKIEDFIKMFEERKLKHVLNRNGEDLVLAGVKFNSKIVNHKVYRLVLESGREIKATGDHKFLTRDGWKEVYELKEDDEVLVYPALEGVGFEVDERRIIDINEFYEFLTNYEIKLGYKPLGKAKSYKELITRDKEKILNRILELSDKYNKSEIKREIEEDFGIKISLTTIKNLLNGKIDGFALKYVRKIKELGWDEITYDDEKAGIFARLLGFIIGDGHLSKSKEGRILITATINELEGIKKDLEKLGIKASNIIEKDIKHNLDGREIKGKTSFIYIDNRAFYLLLNFWGVEIGNKTINGYNIPKWIKYGNKFVKREFLRGLFGADGTKPYIKKYNINGIKLGIRVENISKDKTLEFFEEVKKMLEEFEVESDIRVSKIDNKNLIELIVKANNKNYLKYLSRISYAYEKDNFARLVGEYLRIKEAYKDIILKEIAENALKEADGEKSLRELARKYNVPVDFIINQLKGKDIGLPRNFMTFEEFLKEKVVDGKYVSERIIKKECIGYRDVYDITCHKDPSFIANGFVSHNCNYPSKIIPPIQSRCAIFRFSPLKKEDIAKKLKEIAEKEGLNLTESGLDAIIYVSEGDMRKAINVLQTAAALSDVIDDEIVYKVSSRARPEEVKKMMQLALDGKFIEARDLLYKLMVEWGMSGEDILNQMFREINNLDIDERKKVELAEAIGETDFRIVEGANERIQLSALLAKMALMGR